MIHVIASPDGFRGQSAQDGHIRAAAFLGGGLVGGALTGAALGGTGGLMPGPLRGAVALGLGAAVFGGAAVEVAGGRPPLLQRDTETPYGWAFGSPVFGPLLTGGLLGTGIATRIGYTVVYLPLLIALASGSWLAGTFIGFTYAGARVAGAGVVVWMARVAHSQTRGRTDDAVALRLLGAGAAARIVSGIATVTFLSIALAQYW